ncbi:hypothetical protein J7F03_17640 [Streptomyces sp. ISL-43]|uniref:hypothetical protein n=1 Tax=Streptomyces sp. ISL-43 TaxID=2819183 RepID=UPI001BE7DDFF|nr:hypothetical protein [Streptomyces sp. ISL-43]MBT2448881.1 hypothetical protein [Streptomyces sp. ISL-43]
MDTTGEGGDPACHLHLLCPVCGAVASERLAPCCARYAGPVRHPWLGVLRPDADGTPLRQRLFPGRFDVISPDAMDVAFGYRDLGTLLVRVDGSGQGREVRPEP